MYSAFEWDNKCKVIKQNINDESYMFFVVPLYGKEKPTC